METSFFIRPIQGEKRYALTVYVVADGDCLAGRKQQKKHVETKGATLWQYAYEQEIKRRKNMALFGKKKHSLEEIMQYIAALSQEEKDELLSKMQDVSENNETSEEEPAPVEQEEKEETVESGETSPEETENQPVEPADEVATEKAVETEEPMPETPMETPQPEGKTGVNYGELIAAQDAKIKSLEGVITELKKTVETIVENQDKQNFGYSPHASFDDDAATERRNAVLEGYAPRRAEQYK